MDTIDFLFIVFVGVFALAVGGCVADNNTLKYCATKGEAKMMSGGTIICEVKKEAK